MKGLTNAYFLIQKNAILVRILSHWKSKILNDFSKIAIFRKILAKSRYNKICLLH